MDLEAFINDKNRVRKVDVLCVVCDGSNQSIAFLQDGLKHFDQSIPKLLVRNLKEEGKEAVAQSLSAEETAKRLDIEKWIELSIHDEEADEGRKEREEEIVGGAVGNRFREVI